jgi:replicative DNA helicase
MALLTQHPTGPAAPALTDRPVPYDLGAEDAVIGALLLDRDGILQVAPFLTAAHFYQTTHATLYRVMQDLAGRGVPPDFVTLDSELRRQGLSDAVGGPAIIPHCMAACPSPYHIEYYARRVEETARLRGAIAGGGQIAALGYETGGALPDVMSQIRTIAASITTAPQDATGLRPAGELLTELERTLFAPEAHPGQVRGVPTGLPWLDTLTGGLLRQNVYVLAARPAMGKTSLMVQIAAFNARLGVNVGVFSLEMSAEQIMQRFLAHSTPCDLQALQTGYRMTSTDWAAVHRQYTAIRDEWTLFVDPSPASDVQTACARARQRALTDGLDLLCFDYLQLFNGVRQRGESREQEVAAVSRALKDLARELNVPILALGQLSRNAENRPGPPRLSDLRESGAIEMDAYLVAFLHHEYGAVDGLTDLIVEKHRNGPTGATRLRFHGPTTTFAEDR